MSALILDEAAFIQNGVSVYTQAVAATNTVTGAKIVTKAVSGDCDIRLCGQRSENKGSFVVGDGSTEIFAETISGDITLRE